MTDAMAARMYGGGEPVAAPSGEPVSPPDVTAPAAVEPEPAAASAPVAVEGVEATASEEKRGLLPIPDEVKALRNTVERRMFDATVRPDISAMFIGDDSSEMPEDLKASIALETTRVVDDLGLNDADINAMKSAARSIAESYTPETFAAMEVDAMSALREAFGDRADAALDAAKKLVARDSRVSAFLLRTGLGSDPGTVVRFARLAMKG